MFLINKKEIHITVHSNTQAEVALHFSNEGVTKIDFVRWTITNNSKIQCQPFPKIAKSVQALFKLQSYQHAAIVITSVAQAAWRPGFYQRKMNLCASVARSRTRISFYSSIQARRF